ncbi:hypothetical protein [Hymenobacter sp. AT01-02]|uniref:hypothetical protein n=1 Tax=Hymenobacter sp. AT01-02 TaxID=1571877 RepID=UPI0006E418EA|nr:hypothetical protein [Hymenobacter sp. AT01-02]
MSARQSGSAPIDLEATTDTLEVTSYEVKKEIGPALKNWQIHEINQEVIAVPSGWKQQVDGLVFHLIPPHSHDEREGLSFMRYEKDDPTIKDDRFVWQRSRHMLSSFKVMTSDTLQKVERQSDTLYEQNTTLLKKGTLYQGYFLACVTDSMIYEYNLILAQAKVKDYSGDLKQDILTNLQIGKQYLFFGDDNPVRRIISLKRSALQGER